MVMQIVVVRHLQSRVGLRDAKVLRQRNLLYCCGKKTLPI